MNVLWLSHLVPYPPKGGVLQRSFNLIKETAKNHDIYLLAFNQKALLPNDERLEEALTSLKQICKNVTVLPIPCERWRYGRYFLYLKSLFTSTPFTINWLQSNRMNGVIREKIEEFRVDLVHFDTLGLVPFLNAVGNCKKVLNHHNIESAMMLRRSINETNLLKKFYMYLEGYKIRRYERQNCGEFDLNVTCSRLDSQRLLEFIPRLKVEEIPNGVDLDYFFPLNLKKVKNSLIFAGGMNWYPNRDAMLFFADKVWPLLKKEITDIKVTVVGQDPPSKLMTLAREDKNFVVTGFVDDVRPYIDQAEVYICPIKDGGGTKLKVLDALAMGKAIVANPIACEGIDVVNGKSVLFASAPSIYVEKIKMLLNDDKLLQSLGNNGRKLVIEKYSFNSIGQKLSHLYNSI